MSARRVVLYRSSRGISTTSLCSKGPNKAFSQSSVEQAKTGISKPFLSLAGMAEQFLRSESGRHGIGARINGTLTLRPRWPMYCTSIKKWRSSMTAC
jgi:hypothetical protein